MARTVRYGEKGEKPAIYVTPDLSYGFIPVHARLYRRE